MPLTANEKKKLEEEIQDQEDEFYGDETVSGTSPDPDKINKDDTEERLHDVIGNDPDDDEDGFNLGDEVNEDEHSIRDDPDKPVEDYFKEEEEE